jgi:hypothetical protein
VLNEHHERVNKQLQPLLDARVGLVFNMDDFHDVRSWLRADVTSSIKAAHMRTLMIMPIESPAVERDSGVPLVRDRDGMEELAELIANNERHLMGLSTLEAHPELLSMAITLRNTMTHCYDADIMRERDE